MVTHLPNVRMNCYSSWIVESFRDENFSFHCFKVSHFNRQFSRISPKYISGYPVNGNALRTTDIRHESVGHGSVVCKPHYSVACRRIIEQHTVQQLCENALHQCQNKLITSNIARVCKSSWTIDIKGNCHLRGFKVNWRSLVSRRLIQGNLHRCHTLVYKQ